MNPRPAWVSWSGGKDAAWALHVARREAAVEPVGLLTTVTEGYDRVSMHGVRIDLVRDQAAATGLPLHEVAIPPDCPNEEYEREMAAAMETARERGVDTVVFGDLHLEDVRAYREENLARAGMRAAFPLWGRDTAGLAREMIAAGVRATVVCLDPDRAPRALAGAALDDAFLGALPDGVDPCGENGEFHTFVHAGPMLREPVACRRGRTVERDGFVFTDLVTGSADGAEAA